MAFLKHNGNLVMDSSGKALGLNALISRANSATGAGDGTLSDCVTTLISGYNPGGVDPVIMPRAYANSTIASYEGNNAAILSYAFSNCRSLSMVSFPRATYIGSWAFMSANLLAGAYFPNVEILDEYAFSSCNIVTASFPLVKSIPQFCFYNCQTLNTISFPLVTYIGQAAFQWCGAVSEFMLPNVVSMPFMTFFQARIRNIYLPKLTSLASSMFCQCQYLKSVSIPEVTRIGWYAFSYCKELSGISLPKISYIDTRAFTACFKLLSVYLMSTSVCSLANSYVFSSTPIAGYTSSTSGVYGSIYVPASLLTSYQTTTNWAYFSSRFVGVE